jgi:hypothetical protein
VDATLPQLLSELGISVNKSEMTQNIRPLLKTVFSRFFGPATGLVDALRDHCPSPLASGRNKIESLYTGALRSVFTRRSIPALLSLALWASIWLFPILYAVYAAVFLAVVFVTQTHILSLSLCLSLSLSLPLSLSLSLSLSQTVQVRSIPSWLRTWSTATPTAC